MARFKKAVITEKGLALINKVQTGSVNLEFTKISTGEGDYNGFRRPNKSHSIKGKETGLCIKQYRSC